MLLLDLDRIKFSPRTPTRRRGDRFIAVASSSTWKFGAPQTLLDGCHRIASWRCRIVCVPIDFSGQTLFFFFCLLILKYFDFFFCTLFSDYSSSLYTPKITQNVSRHDGIHITTDYLLKVLFSRHDIYVFLQKTVTYSLL